MIGSAHLQDARILLIDDEFDHLTVLEGVLRQSGFRAIVGAQSSTEAVDLFSALAPDLVVLNLEMGQSDAFDILTSLEALLPDEDFVPILGLTAGSKPQLRSRALAAGVRDLLERPYDAIVAVLRVRNLIETRVLHREVRRRSDTLESKVRERTYALADAQMETLRRLAVAAEYREDVTGRHAERVGLLSALLADELGLHREEVQLLRRAAPLHDVGKIGVPDSILKKPGPLTAEEFEIVKTHTRIGAGILAGSHYPVLELARTVAASHHERWDGTGYTPGLAGESIPLVGRIVAVADVFDSLTQRRPYKEALPIPVAVDTVRAKRGTHFDPRIVDVFDTLVGQGVLEELEARTGGPSTLPPTVELPPTKEHNVAV